MVVEAQPEQLEGVWGNLPLVVLQILLATLLLLVAHLLLLAVLLESPLLLGVLDLVGGVPALGTQKVPLLLLA